MNSKQFRLSMASCWTEVEHVKGGGAIEMMRLEDGNSVVLSLIRTEVKVFVTPTLENADGFAEVATFTADASVARLEAAPQALRAENESILVGLRKAIGFPKSVEELCATVISSLDSGSEDGACPAA